VLVNGRILRFRSALAAALFLASSAAPVVARAQGTGASCIKASEEGIDARERGALRAARAHFVKCAAETCPKALRVDCARWLDDVDASLPSIVVGAKDERGADLFDARVKVDGEVIEDVQAGRPLVLDPGPHVVRFERGVAPDVEVQEVKVLLRTGERHRSVSAVMGRTVPVPKDGPPAAYGDTRGPPLATWIFGGVGVLALGSFGTFAVLGAQEKSRLRDTCSPGCRDADVATLRTEYLIADISLGVGLVALGVATYFLLTNKSSPQRLARTIWK
jgi:hypothetical protein